MQHFQRKSLTCITLAVLLGACSEETIDTPKQQPPTGQAGASVSAGAGASAGASASAGGSSASAGSSGASALAGSAATSAGTGAGGGSAQKPLELPFYVNSPGNFVKSGFMGDAATSVLAAPSASNSDGTCGDLRASATAGGDCDTFEVTPADAGEGWQGVFYQFPSGNWGALPGRAIAEGATRVTFSVRASRPVALQVQVGMCDAAHPDDAATCGDGFFVFPDDADAAHKLSVGSEWTSHTITLEGADYSGGVRGAFSWVLVNDDLLGDTTPLSVYLDDMAWQ